MHATYPAGSINKRYNTYNYMSNQEDTLYQYVYGISFRPLFLEWEDSSAGCSLILLEEKVTQT